MGKILVKTQKIKKRQYLLSNEDVREIFKRFSAATPHPQGELSFTNPFTLLIAVILSAQSTDKGVNKATKHLFLKADTPQKILSLGEDALKNYIKTIGLYNTKAKNIIKVCQILIDKHNGDVPHNRQALEALPGVGRKTANVVLNTAFNHPTIAVDTHLFRVANRTGMAPGKTPEAVEEKLYQMIPSEFHSYAHHWLILHGRYICKAKKPLCSKCLINDICLYPLKEF